MLRKVTISKFKYKNFALLNKKMFFYSINKNVILNLEFYNRIPNKRNQLSINFLMQDYWISYASEV